jgi:hypothetical protein
MDKTYLPHKSLVFKTQSLLFNLYPSMLLARCLDPACCLFLFTSSTKTVLPCAHCFQLIHKLPSRHRSVDRPSGIDIKLTSAQR